MGAAAAVSKRRQAWSGPWCSGQVYSGTPGGGWSPCKNRGKHAEGGRGYCGLHLPSKLKAREEARDRKWRKDWDAKQARRSRSARVALAEEILVREVLSRESNVPGWLKLMVEDVRKARAS